MMLAMLSSGILLCGLPLLTVALPLSSERLTLPLPPPSRMCSLEPAETIFQQRAMGGTGAAAPLPCYGGNDL